MILGTPDTGGHTTLGSCGRMGAEEASRPVRRRLQLTKQEMMKNWTADIERRGITVEILRIDHRLEAEAEGDGRGKDDSRSRI